MKKLSYLLAVLLGIMVCVPAVSAKNRDARLQENTENAMEILLDSDATLEEWFDDAYGYAIFPSVGKGGFGIGGAFGKGEVYEGGDFIGEARLTQGSIGFQLGGQVYIEVIFFEKEANLENFKESQFELSAQASAVAAAEGASVNAKYEHGVAIFTVAKGGLMYEASVGGQKFKYIPKD